MATYIALLRGINVGGTGSLPMKELVAILELLGCRNVKTYIQSGNAVFEHKSTAAAKLAGKITAAIRERCGFAPHTIVLDNKEQAKIVKQNPFPQGEAEPKTLHVFFLESKPTKAAMTSLDDLKSDSEQFELRGTAFYFFAPDGIGRSKLAANVERKLGVTATSRNWRTVGKLLEIAHERE
jgi:uncharacterized protein (DUF1697 family)